MTDFVKRYLHGILYKTILSELGNHFHLDPEKQIEQFNPDSKRFSYPIGSFGGFQRSVEIKKKCLSDF